MPKDHVHSTLTLAFALHQKQQFDEAEKLYGFILKDNPSYTPAQHGLGILLAQTNRHQKAQEQLKAVINKEPNNPTFHLSYANVLLALEDFDQAKHHYKEAIKIAPTYIQAINNLGNAYFKTGEYMLAKQYYEKAVKHSALPQYLFNLSNAHLSLNNAREAIDHLQSITEHPDFILDAKKLMAQAHLKIGLYDQALKWYLRALELSPSDASMHHESGICYLQLKDYTKAIEAFLKTIDLEPEHTEAYYHLANTYLAVGKVKQAKSFYLNQITYSKMIECYFNVGVLLEKEGRHQEAITFFTSCLEINPDYIPAHQNIASSYLQANRIDQAIKHYEILHNLDENNSEYNHILSALKQTHTPEKTPDQYIQNLFDHYAPHYNAHMQNFLDYQVPQKILDLLESHHLSGKPLNQIIDLGCGSGLCGHVLHPHTHTLIGIDLSEKMLEQARKTGFYNELICDNIETRLGKILPSDGLVASDVLSYLGDLNQLFEGVFKALKPSGFFCFTIEKTHQYPYVLQKSIRYAHHKSYIHEQAQIHGLEIVSYENIQLRKHHQSHIEGYLFLLKKPS